MQIHTSCTTKKKRKKKRAQPILASAFSLPLSGREERDISLRSHSCHYPPSLSSVHLIFQSGLSVCLSESVTLCSPLYIAENISMWSWAHLSEPDGCLSNSSASSAAFKVKRKKGQQTLAWFKAPHLAYTYSYRHTNSVFYTSLHSTYSIFTKHLHVSTSLQYQGHSRISVWWEMSPKCCSRPSDWPHNSPAFTCLRGRGECTNKTGAHIRTGTHTHNNLNRQSLGPQPKRLARLCQLWPSSH